jgi:hypothetical protein
MNQDGTTGADRQRRLSEVLADWLEAAEQGTPPEEAEYLRRYPELAGELAECFAAWRRFPRPELCQAPEKTSDPASASPFPAFPGHHVFGVLGIGGMGIVLKARQKQLNRLVALKMLTTGGGADPEQLARFRT